MRTLTSFKICFGFITILALRRIYTGDRTNGTIFLVYKRHHKGLKFITFENGRHTMASPVLLSYPLFLKNGRNTAQMQECKIAKHIVKC